MKVLTKPRNDLKQPKTTYNEKETTWNDLRQQARNKQKPPKTTYNEQQMTWNDLKQARNDLKQPATSKTTTYILQRPEPTHNEQKKDAKLPTASILWDYFTIWGNHFQSDIWFQSFEHCFTENHGENRAPSSSILTCVFFMRYRIYKIRCEPLWHS